MLEIDFNLFDHNFCEATIYSSGQHPEYLNAFSSLFITFIGLNGMRKINNDNILMSTYTCLAVNGILSSYYHYYNTIGYGLLDRMSMILLALNTTYMFIGNMKIIFQFSKFINIMINIIAISYYSFMLTIAGLHIEWLFNTLFSLFLISICIYILIVKKYSKHICLNTNILSIGMKGTIYILCSGIFWVSTELLCSKFSFIKYLYGHVWWHVFVSYGGYLVSLVPYYINMTYKYGLSKEIIICYDIFRIPYIRCL